MLETFQDRLVTELRLTRASTIDEAGLVLRNFCWKCRGLPGNVLDPGRFSSGGHGPTTPVSRCPLGSSPSVGRPA